MVTSANVCQLFDFDPEDYEDGTLGQQLYVNDGAPYCKLKE